MYIYVYIQYQVGVNDALKTKPINPINAFDPNKLKAILVLGLQLFIYI